MLRALDGDVSISLVDIYRGPEALCNFLGQANLLLRHKLVCQALGLRAFPSVLGLRSDNLLGGNCPLSGCQVALLHSR